jgi:hypothetical protein
MRSIAIGWRPGPLAATQIDGLLFRNAELERFEVGILVGTVTEGLGFRAAATAPPVVTRFEFDFIRRGLGANGFGHGCLLTRFVNTIVRILVTASTSDNIISD